MLARLAAVDVHPQAGGPGRHLLGQLQLVVHLVLSGAGSAGQAGVGCGDSAPTVGEARPEAGEHRRGVAEVIMEHRGHHVRVAQAERGQDRGVQVGNPAPVDARHDHRDVGARERLQRPPHPLERRIPGELDDPAVEGGVGRRLGVVVAVLCRPLHLADVSGEGLEVLVGQARDGKAGAERLQLGADHERLEELVRRRAADASSPEGGGLHDAQRLEVAQRLPHRGLARPELPGNPGLDDPGARRVATVKDRLEQAILDLIAQDAARDRGFARHGGGVSPVRRRGRPRRSRGSPRRRRCRRRGAGPRS